MTEETFYNLMKKYEFLCKRDNKSLSTIKSHLMFQYMERVQPLLFWKAKFLPYRKFSKYVRCQWCLNEWTEGQFSLKLVPERRQKPCLYRLFKKDKSKLNKYQLKLVLKYKERSRSNALILLCNTCGKETTVYIPKPNKDDSLEVLDDVPAHPQVEIVKEKKCKKKKKPDRCADLNPFWVKPSKVKRLPSEKIVTKQKGTKEPSTNKWKTKDTMRYGNTTDAKRKSKGQRKQRFNQKYQNYSATSNAGKKNSVIQNLLSLT